MSIIVEILLVLIGFGSLYISDKKEHTSPGVSVFFFIIAMVFIVAAVILIAENI